jgi:hypothetical protein
MKRIVLLLGALAFVASSASAGLKYEFSSVTPGRGGSKMIGTAKVEGANMRLDLKEGDNVLFQNNSVVISNDGGKTLLVLDPKKKTYYELSLEDTFQAMGSMMQSMGGMIQMSIDNQSVEVADGGDGGTIQGYPTRKHLVTTSYDFAIKVMGMNRSSHIDMKTESWSTDKISEDSMTSVQVRRLRTGMEDLDELIAAQTAAVKGFPLKQIITTTTTQGKKSNTQTTTMEVTSIEQMNIANSEFEVPAGYEKGESPLAAMQGLGRR